MSGPSFNREEEEVPENNTAGQQPDPNAPLTPEQVQAAWNEEAAQRGGQPNAAGTPAADPLPAAETPPEEPPDTPEFPEELKAALAQVDSMKALVDRLTHQVSSSEGRLGAIQRELQQSKQAAQAVNRAPNEQAVRAAAKTPEKWATLKSDFPEWAEAVESLVDTVRSDPSQVDFSSIREELHGALADTTKKFYGALEEAKLFGAHRNYRQIVNADDFKSWQAIQAPEVQALAQSPHAADAIDMIDRFMDFRQKEKDRTRDVTTERNQRLQAAAQPAVKRNAPPPKRDEDLSATDIWNQEAGRRLEKRAART